MSSDRISSYDLGTTSTVALAAEQVGVTDVTRLPSEEDVEVNLRAADGDRPMQNSGIEDQILVASVDIHLYVAKGTPCRAYTPIKINWPLLSMYGRLPYVPLT